jgi:tRNA A-37 threonylcarbamoyl transferase component Bud32
LWGDDTLDGAFEKIRKGNSTLYIRRPFLNNDLGQAILSGGKKLREQYNLETIPSSEFTRIYRFHVSIDGVERQVYLKHFLSRSSLDYIKSIFRGSRAKRALKAELMLARNGFDVPTAIAIVEYGNGFFHTESFAATLGLADIKSALRLVSETGEISTREQLSGRRELIRLFGRTIGRMHASNIFHGDLRLNNVLLRREGGNWRFFFLDNERTRKFNKLPFRCRVKNLVQLNMTPPSIVSKTDRMRFFREYRAETGTGREAGKALIAAILKKTVQRIDTRERSQTKIREAFRTGAGYLWIEASNYRAAFDKDFCEKTELADFIANLERLIREGQILEENRNYIVSSIRWNDRKLIVRQYAPKGLIHSLRQTIGKSSAKQDWLNGCQLKTQDAGTNKPLAYIELLKSGFVWKSYFVTEYT